MRIKELKKTVNLSWSPEEHYPVLLAAGTAAQQVDASFSPTSHLELYGLNLGDSSQDLELKSSVQTQHKFHKLAWSGAGVIVGGCDDGLLEFYNVEKLLKNANDALIGTSNKHQGHVSTLDINPYQKNLLASGASDSEIFIWDLSNTSQPMAPGNRSQPYDHVQEVAWNQQVQHILGSTFSTRCVVWDLRKNEPIMKLSDPQSRTRWSSVAWHPSVATQLCLASEDDQSPVIQLWDLRLASSPLKTLDGHQLGVLSLSWCKQDSNILLSAGKDGLINCYNPNDSTGGAAVRVWGAGGAVGGAGGAVRAVAAGARVPALLAASALHAAAVHSLLGCAHAPQNVQSQNNIMDSFGGALGSLPAVPAPGAPAAAPPPQPPHAPAWLARRTAARFAFGGKLVTFEKCQDAAAPKQVVISQVVSEPAVVEKAHELDEVLALTMSQEPSANAALAEYCRARGDAAHAQHERSAWFLLRAHFLPSFKDEVLDLLGFKQDDVTSVLKGSSAHAGDVLANDIAGLNVENSGDTEAENTTDANTELSGKPDFDRKLSNVEITADIRDIVIPNGDDHTSRICRALVCGEVEAAVELCLQAERTPDAMLIASLGSPELLYKVQKYHLRQTAADPVSLIAGCVLSSQWDRICASSHVDSWRQTLAAIVTHAPPDKQSECCAVLGERALAAGDSGAALACFVAGNVAERAAAAWRAADVALLLLRASRSQVGRTVEAVLVHHAARLAAQGVLAGAARLLAVAPRGALYERLRVALGGAAPAQAQQQPSNVQHRTRTISSHRRPQAPHNDVATNYNTVSSPHEAAQWSRPPSAGPPAGGITSRSKYKVDPSVHSAPSYNQYSYNNPITSQPHQFGLNNGMDPYNSSGVSNSYGNINQAPIAPLNPMNSPLNPMNPGNPSLNPMNPGNPSLNSMNTSLNPMNPSLTPMNPGFNQMGDSGSLNATVNGGHAPAPVVGRPPVAPAAPGWNDPPMLSSKPKPKQEVPTQAPITHPLFGVEAPQHLPLAGAQYPGQGQQFPGQGQQYPGQGQQFPGQGQQFPGQGQQFPGQGQQFPGQGQQFPGQGQQFPGQGQQFPGQRLEQQGYPEQQYGGQFDQQYQGQFQSMNMQMRRESPAPAEPALPVQKAAIPGEHVPLQTSFDSLRAQCAELAVNPQMKRKLEDVQRRLEAMYDMLREYRLSESALSSLHACSQRAAAGEYDAALELATALATTPDFASVASFLPGLKVLFQIARQLQVYPR